MDKWIARTFLDAIPAPGIQSPVAWAEKYVRLVGSALTERFTASATPWNVEPIESACGGKSEVTTYIKPVQSGGSSAGFVALCHWLANESGGDVQQNWEDDKKAADKWLKLVEKIIEACEPVMARAPLKDKQSGKWKVGQIIFGHANLTVQGAFASKNLDSDTIRFQINEEVHNWKPGHLQKAYNRTSAVWNRSIFNISNAGTKNDQLHRAFMEGTQQHWEVKCPGCGRYHVMQTRWDSSKPEEGGLRYDSSACKLEDGSYDYNKLAATVRYQMPCGYEVKDEITARKALSQSGRYGAPRNKGALLTNRSYTLEAVSVHFIPWIRLITEKHDALRAMRLGDPEPYRRYKQERECIFWDPEDRPIVGRVVVTPEIVKDRNGLPDRVVRFGALDYQQGRKDLGELPYWWGVIRDFDAKGNSLLVYEGKSETDEEAHDVMQRHDVSPTCVVADSGHNAPHVYNFCLRYGYNAIKGGGEPTYAHKDGTRRIFGPEKPLHKMVNAPPTKHADEPLFWFYSKAGIRERLHWLRSSPEIQWVVPSDVSEDYMRHMEAEELQERDGPRGEKIYEWVQLKKRNDLFVCECYIAMLADMAGLIAVGAITKAQDQAKESIIVVTTA